MLADPLITLRFPKLIDLRGDPFEIAQEEAGDYDKWRVDMPSWSFLGGHCEPALKTKSSISGRAAFQPGSMLEKLQQGGAGQQVIPCGPRN